MIIKSKIRALGIDDGPFDKFKNKRVRIYGTVMRGNSLIEGFLTATIRVDGDDVTNKVIDMIKNSQFKTQIRVIFTDGITFGGFNILDPFFISNNFNIPVIVVIRKNPDIEKIRLTLKKLNKLNELKILNSLPKPIYYNNIFFQPINIDEEKSKRLIDLFTLSSFLPEPLRISHLIGQMFHFKRSKGHP